LKISLSAECRANDTVILTTSELLNNISLDRLQQELSSPNTTESTQLIADLLQETAEKDLSVGTIFLNIGKAPLSAEQALYKIEAGVFKAGLIERGKKILALSETALKMRSSISFQRHDRRFKNRRADLRPAAIKQRAVEMVDVKKFRALPRTKKFFISMAVLFIILIIADIVVGVHLKRTHRAEALTASIFSEIKDDVNNANSDQIYGNSDQAKNMLADAETKLAELSPSATSSDEGKQISQQVSALNDTINKITPVSTASVADFGMHVDRLLMIGPNIYGINYSGSSIAGYNLSAHNLSPAQSVAASAALAMRQLLPQTNYCLKITKVDYTYIILFQML